MNNPMISALYDLIYPLMEYHIGLFLATVIAGFISGIVKRFLSKLFALLALLLGILFVLSFIVNQLNKLLFLHIGNRFVLHQGSMMTI